VECGARRRPQQRWLGLQVGPQVPLGGGKGLETKEASLPRARRIRWLRRLLFGLGLAAASVAVLDPRHSAGAGVGMAFGVAGALMPGGSKRWLVATLIACLAISAMSVGPFRGDSVRYFEHLHSLAFDRDLDYANDARLLDVPTRPNVFPVGPAIAWSPAFLVAQLYVVGSNWRGDHAYPANGVSTPYRRSPALATVVWAVLAVWLLATALTKRLGLGVALTACLGGFLVSPIPYYIWILPSMAHGVAFAAAALLMWALLSADDTPTLRTWILVGFSLGLVSLMRWQAVVAAALVVTLAVSQLAHRRARVRWLVAGAFTSLLVTVPQMIVWRLQYGSYLTVPQGGSFLDWWSPRLFDVLMSADHGLFTWHPWLLLGVVGLVVGAFQREWLPLSIGSLLTFVACAWVNGSVRTWRGDDAFGARRFDVTVVLFILGLALLTPIAVRWVRRFPLAVPACVLALGSLWNVGLMRLKQEDRIPRNAPLQVLASDQARHVEGATSWLLERAFGRKGRGIAYRIFQAEYLYETINPSGTFALAHTNARFLGGAGGWSEPKVRVGWPAFRWAVLPESCIILPLDGPDDLRVAVTGRSPGGVGASAPVPAAVNVNGEYLTKIEFPPDWGRVRFTIPEGRLFSGQNWVCFDFGRESAPGRRDPGAAVSVVQLP
jgi:hypothetical protein